MANKYCSLIIATNIAIKKLRSDMIVVIKDMADERENMTFKVLDSEEGYKLTTNIERLEFSISLIDRISTQFKIDLAKEEILDKITKLDDSIKTQLGYWTDAQTEADQRLSYIKELQTELEKLK